MIELLKILGPALITAFIAYFTAKYHFKTKREEIIGESEFKAREHMFNVYRKKIEKHQQDFEKDCKFLGEMFGYYFGLSTPLDTDYNSDSTFAKEYLSLIKPIIASRNEIIKDELPELESDLEKEGLLNEINKKQISFVRHCILTNIDFVNKNQLKYYWVDYLKAMNIFGFLENELLEKKCKELFEPFITNAGIK